MTTLVTPQTRPSPTPPPPGLSLSPECPQVWTEDVDNVGDNSPYGVRFERSAYLSPSVDHLWMVSRQPLVGSSRICGRNCSHWGRTTDVIFLSPDQPTVIHAPTHSQSPTQQPASTRKFPVMHRIHIPYDDDYLFSFINNYTTFTDVPVDISP